MTEVNPFGLNRIKDGSLLMRNLKVLLNTFIFFTTRNAETKVSIVEQFQRTLKARMWRYFSRHKTRRYVDIIPDLVYAYNHSYHRSFKRAPDDVNSSNV